MKNKNKTYLLLTVVLAIWGVIIFKFLGAVNPSSKAGMETTSEAVFVPRQIKERKLFALALDYRDPFLGTVEAPKKKRVTPKTPPVPNKGIPTKSVRYTGFIQQKNSKQLIFFVTVEGQQQLMKVNAVFQEVKLVKGTKNEITVTYGGKTDHITLTK